MKPVGLIDARVEDEYGGKAYHLAAALGAGLPVPPGFALDYQTVEAIFQQEAAALENLQSTFARMRCPIAVRSSAVGEDSDEASFAGQHASVLNVTSFSQLKEAISRVVESASTLSAAYYRKRLGVESSRRMGIVLQELVDPEVAGVLFTRNPVTGADERVIESAWGLGEVVVAGLVIPDYYRMTPTGTILERRPGEKDLALRILPDGGTEEVPVDTEKAVAPTLTDEKLQELYALSVRCESVYGRGIDIEWCFARAELHLLQCRMITASGP